MLIQFIKSNEDESLIKTRSYIKVLNVINSENKLVKLHVDLSILKSVNTNLRAFNKLLEENNSENTFFTFSWVSWIQSYLCKIVRNVYDYDSIGINLTETLKRFNTENDYCEIAHIINIPFVNSYNKLLFYTESESFTYLRYFGFLNVNYVGNDLLFYQSSVFYITSLFNILTKKKYNLTIYKEVTTYLKLLSDNQIELQAESVISYWEKLKFTFPASYQTSKVILRIPVSNADTERAIKGIKFVLSDERLSLKEESIRHYSTEYFNS